MSSTIEQTYPDAPKDLPPEVDEWLAEHPEETAEELEEVWQLAEKAPPGDASFSPDPGRVAAMRAELLARITIPSAGNATTNVFRLNRTWAVAASILVVFAVGAVLLWSPVKMTARAGQIRQVTLSDGSEVMLNSGSSLSHSRIFGWWSRSVELEGEAFFAVTKASDPFQVNTFNSTVTVVGTQFNVRAWAAGMESETRVILTEGVVRLSGLDTPEQAVELHEGQMSRIDATSGAPSRPIVVDTERLLVWRSGGLAYFEMELGDALADIQRRFGVEIHAEAEILDRQVSLFLSRPETVEEVLDVLATLHGLQWLGQSGEYELLDTK